MKHYKGSRTNSLYHHRRKRYIRYMLRRYVKMRREFYALDFSSGTMAICGLNQKSLLRLLGEKAYRKLERTNDK